MRPPLQRLLQGLSFAFATTVANGQGDAPNDLSNVDDPIPQEIVELATDPLASPDGAFPFPGPQHRLEEPTHSSLFYALPVIGFWLILRRRGRGVRL